MVSLGRTLTLAALLLPLCVVASCTGSGGPADDADGLIRSFALPLPLFSASSPWNQRADSAQVLAESDQQMLTLYRVTLGDTTNLYPVGVGEENPWPFLVLNYYDWTVPIGRTGDGLSSVRIRNYDGGLGWTNGNIPIEDEGGPVLLPAAAGRIRPSDPQGLVSDGHLCLYDEETNTEYDFWQATTQLSGSGNSLGGGREGSAVLEAGAADLFSLSGDGVNSPDYYSARASGVPLLGGLLVPEDIQGGAIRHALACAIPRLRNTDPTAAQGYPASDVFAPATTTEVGFYNTSPLAIAAGQRLRMRSSLVDAEGESIDESALAPVTRMFLTALREYGAYALDNSGGLCFYAEDVHTGRLDLTDAEVNALIGAPAGTPLESGKTAWRIVLERLDLEIGVIPIASGDWEQYGDGGADPSIATLGTANFDVVDPADYP